MKKGLLGIVSILLILVMVLTIAGCGNGEDTTDVSKESKATEAVQEDAGTQTTDPVTIKMYTWNANTNENGVLVEQAIVDAFEAENPGIKVVIETLTENDSNEYLKKLDLALMAGDEVDIISTKDTASYVQRVNMFEPLNNYFAAEGVDFNEKFVVDTEVEGNYYGMPYDMGYRYVMINKDYLDAAGLETPSLDWTWEDYREYAKAMTQGEGQEKIYGSYMHSWGEYKYLAPSVVIDDNVFFNEDGSSSLSNPVFGEWLSFMKALEDEDQSQIPYADVLSSKMAYRDVFFSGKAAMIPIGTWMVREVGLVDKLPHDFKTVFAPLPTWNGSQEGRTLGYTTYLNMNKNSQYKEEAYKFMMFYCTEGMLIKASAFSAERNSDVDQMIEKMINGNDKYYDIESLQEVLKNPNLSLNMFGYIPEYNAEVSNAFNEEAEIFLVDGQTLDEAISKMKQRIDDIISMNK